MPLRKQSQTWNCGAVLLSENKDHHFQMYVSYNNCKTKKKSTEKLTRKHIPDRFIETASQQCILTSSSYVFRSKKNNGKSSICTGKKKKKRKKRTSLQVSDEK